MTLFEKSIATSRLKRSGLVGGLTVVLLASCQTINTTLPTSTDGTMTGIPYFLPKSMLRISIESKKDAKGVHSELVVGSAAELVPDPKAGLVLASDENELFSRKQTFALTNGMLSTIAIEDEGKAGDILIDLASIAFNVMSFAALGPGAGLAGQVTVSRTPDGAEILEALTSIAPGQQVYILSLNDNKERYLSGTGELVAFRANTPDLPDVEPNAYIREANGKSQTRPAPPPLEGNGRKPQDHGTAKPVWSFDGIVTKVLEPYPTEVTLLMNLRRLYENRIEKATKAVKDKVAEIDDTQIEIDKIAAELARAGRDVSRDPDLKKQKAEFTKKKVTAEREKLQLAEQKSANEALFKQTNAEAPPLYPIGNQASIILIPDYSPLVKIPMSRSPIGKTTYNLSLNRGVLTSISFERPSAVLEVVKVPLKISEALVKLPTQILQLKIDYSSKVKELVTKQSELDTAKKSLAAATAGKSDHQVAKELLEREKEILTLQKDIADLRAKIAEIEKK